MSIRSLRVWSKIEHRIHRWDQRQIDRQRSGPFWVRTPESVGEACQGNFEPPVWPNIHSLYETNGAETFRAEELPYVRRSGVIVKESTAQLFDGDS